MLKALAKQLIRDLKASWKKTAALAVLLLVGLCFWLPPLLRAVGAGAGPGATAANTALPAALGNIAPTVVNAGGGPAADDRKADYHWKTRSRMLETDPLVQSVDVAAISANPFQIDNDQFPPPVLFADEPRVDPKPAAASSEPAEPNLDHLVLKSTIVGVNRRAAFINTRLYQEGKEVRIDGESYLLSAVYPRKVILKQGDREFELTIKGPLATDE